MMIVSEIGQRLKSRNPVPAENLLEDTDGVLGRTKRPDPNFQEGRGGDAAQQSLLPSASANVCALC